jgi:hypothetical protein
VALSDRGPVTRPHADPLASPDRRLALRFHVSSGPTEAVNNLIKRVKRAAFGFTSFRNYRIRSLLYAGKPNWDLLATVTPR